ncbi:hypothetical protein FRC12_007486 [Ceratobasidium sp. 428]|nr:hypothetical protein FRC12_007486 [Ceratobasidium sp. 428]
MHLLNLFWPLVSIFTLVRAYPPGSSLTSITPSHPETTSSVSGTPTYHSSSTTSYTSVSCKNVVRDEQHKRWTCAPNPSTTSTTFEYTTPTPVTTTTSYYSSSMSLYTSVSRKNVVRDEQHKRWTCAPNPSPTSTTFTYTTPATTTTRL